MAPTGAAFAANNPRPDVSRPSAGTLWLASRSPQRAALLRAAGYRFSVLTPGYADPADPNRSGVDTRDGPALARMLAERKAASVPATADADGWDGGVLLAADTLVIAPDGGLLGTPETADEAAATLRRLRDATHTIATGVCLRGGAGGAGGAGGPCADASWVETAAVRFGPLPDAVIAEYVATGAWRGRAGGYNLTERRADGWPVRVDGDDDTVTGMPVRAVRGPLAARGVHPWGPAP